ncbi:hypothetical protein [Undibacter mobilis]|uniref:Uncharacterized protein n=1 Tax=Undibacter mobilis TaxID=2292256 RepID=A0A371B8H9_9BRAD|nr:hypothetical protein [Undibacter mobilis]RDV03842.1 hypothetical protein DXH78_04125 [Undibacter mobilis]
MQIDAPRLVSSQRPDMTPPDESRQDPVNQESGDTAEQGRALVTVAPQQAPLGTSPYRQAPFLAQLIATRDQAPQTRERRRAEPGYAVAAYRATAALV